MSSVWKKEDYHDNEYENVKRKIFTNNDNKMHMYCIVSVTSYFLVAR